MSELANVSAHEAAAAVIVGKLMEAWDAAHPEAPQTDRDDSQDNYEAVIRDLMAIGVVRVETT